MALPSIAAGPRLDAVRARIDEEGLAALIVAGSSNVRWCTGYTGSNGLAVVTPDGGRFITDRRYESQAPGELEAVGSELEILISRDLIGVGASGLTGEVGIDPSAVSWADARAWEKALGRAPIAAPAIVAELRAIKDDAEVARIGAAAAIVDEVLAECEHLLVAGTTERALGTALDDGIRARGSEPGYETIVAGGPNSALPHARPGNRPFESGDLVVIDVGATVDGYRSDMTRTFCVGNPSDEAVAIHALVTEAQAAGVDAVKAGQTTGSIDATSRGVIIDGGFGEQFSHGTGHGVGLDIHEAPSVSTDNAAILQRGHVITVEPGIYLPGIGGVRIEDTLLVTDDGCRPLTSAPKRPL